MTQGFAQTLTFWLHVSSASVWVGAMVFFLCVFGPAVGRLPPAHAMAALDRGRRSLELLSWVALPLLLITGAVSPLFRGGYEAVLLRPGYRWLFWLKLLLVIAALLHHCLQAFRYGPQLGGPAGDAASSPESLQTPWRKWFVLLKINTTLGLIIIILGLGLSRI